MWLIRLDDVEVESDDFTIEDLGEVERSAGVPWSVANPLRDLKVARAFLAVALLRSGMPTKDVEKRLAALTMRDLKHAFEYKPEDDAGPVPTRAAPTSRRAQTSRASSRGRPLKGGSLPIPDDSVSETSSSS